MVHLPQPPSMKMTGLERGPEQEFSQLIEAYPRLKEAEDRPPISDQQSPQPPRNENGASSYATGSDGPSLGQRLVQSSVETLVPGAHFQELARQQLGAGNYVGAGVYQAAALVDAALGVATLGLSTRTCRSRQDRRCRRSCSSSARVRLAFTAIEISRSGSRGYAVASHRRAIPSGSVRSANHTKCRERRSHSDRGASKFECVLLVKAANLLSEYNT